MSCEARALARRSASSVSKVAKEFGLTCAQLKTLPLPHAAKIVRPPQTIENQLHFVRDTTFAEDAPKVRTGRGPENTATQRSFAINRLRTSDHANIAAGLREMSYGRYCRPLDPLDLT